MEIIQIDDTLFSISQKPVTLASLLPLAGQECLSSTILDSIVGDFEIRYGLYNNQINLFISPSRLSYWMQEYPNSGSTAFYNWNFDGLKQQITILFTLLSTLGITGEVDIDNKDDQENDETVAANVMTEGPSTYPMDNDISLSNTFERTPSPEQPTIESKLPPSASYRSENDIQTSYSLTAAQNTSLDTFSSVMQHNAKGVGYKIETMFCSDNLKNEMSVK
ncbi:hypothetical protein FBU30_001330 [Linnemannia zychae]|nr:hypothetical protein FBU30_001330 [Linnemannia zychae]